MKSPTQTQKAVIPILAFILILTFFVFMLCFAPRLSYSVTVRNTDGTVEHYTALREPNRHWNGVTDIEVPSTNWQEQYVHTSGEVTWTQN